jgi:hypothetical protein
VWRRLADASDVRLAELQEALLAELAIAFADLGYRRRQQSFVREMGAVRWSAHVAFIRHEEDVDLTMDVAVRHHAVERKLEPTRPRLRPAEQLWTATVGVELGNYVKRRPHRWTLRSADDVPRVVGEMMTWFERVGVAFLERYSSLAEVVRALGEEDAEARLICPLPDVRRRVLEAARSLLDERAR